MRILIVAVVVGMQIIACAKGKVRGEDAVWYVVISGQDDVQNGDMVAVEGTGLRFLVNEGKVVFQPVSWSEGRRMGKSEHGQISIKKNTSGITISLNEKEIVRARSATAAEIRSAIQALSDRPTDHSICDRAAKCCKEAMKALDATCDLDSELGNPPKVQNCEGFLKGIVGILEAKEKRVSSCE